MKKKVLGLWGYNTLQSTLNPPYVMGPTGSILGFVG